MVKRWTFAVLPVGIRPSVNGTSALVQYTNKLAQKTESWPVVYLNFQGGRPVISSLTDLVRPIFIVNEGKQAKKGRSNPTRNRHSAIAAPDQRDHVHAMRHKYLHPQMTSPSIPFQTTTMMASNTSTRKRTTSLPASDNHTAHNLPPKPSHRESLRHDINPPLTNTRLSTLIYILVGLTALLTAYFSYLSMQYKSAQQGWISLVFYGRTSPEMKPADRASTAAHSDTIESHIVALAAALGIPTHELASAIAGAVRSYVPPASLSSIKTHETGDVVSVLLQDPTPTSNNGGGGGGGGGAWEAASTAAGLVEDFVEGVESFVGMDEP